jgi:hypothetical protein
MFHFIEKNKMFDFLKRRERNNGTSSLQMVDLDMNPLKPGDLVDAMRYDLGRSKVIETEKGLAYESMETGKVVTWHLMVDAATEFQKVRKIPG